MEKDIKILEEMLKTRKEQKEIIECAGGYCGNCNQDIKALESAIQTIKAYKELKEENEIIKGNYYTLCADIQMVTSELGFPEDTIIADEFVSMIKENYIEKSLVEEKIEELNKLLEEDLQDERKVNSNRFIIICQCKNCLQELLEKRK